MFSNGASRDKSLTGSCAAGCYATGMCGATFDVRLPTKVMEATVSYKVKFDAGYAWGLGGKLPGVCSDGKPRLCAQIQHRHGATGHARSADAWPAMAALHCLCIQSHSMFCG